ncbi:MAG: LysE family transporter [Pseudomonadota bacterium]
MISLALAVFFLIATPGPGVLSLAGIGAAFGFRRAMPYLVGLLIGNTVVMIFVASGLAALVLANPVARTVLLAMSLGYLIYLAMRIAFAGSRIAIIHAENCPGLLAGFLLQPINPKAYAVNAVFITGFPIYPQVYTIEIAIKIAVVTAVWLPLHLVWAWIGATINRLDPPPHVQRAVNIFMAISMLLVVGIASFTVAQ